MGKKEKKVAPDDFFNAGPLKMVRFGEKTIYEVDWPEGEFEKMQEKLVKDFPEVVEKINLTISEIIELVRKQPPAQLLKIAWDRMAVRFMGKESEIDIDIEDSLSASIVEYLQSILVSVPPSDNVNETVSENDWNEIKRLIEGLYHQINFEYLICLTATQKKENPEFSLGYDEFYYKAQIYWCNVRGLRYSFHEETHLRDLLVPHSEIIEELFGINADTLVNELMKIHHSLTAGLQEAFTEFGNFREKTLNEIEKNIESGNLDPSIPPPELLQNVIQEKGWEKLAISEIIVPPVSVMLCHSFRRSLCHFR